MLDFNLFIFACRDLLDIRKPIEIRMTTDKFRGPKNAAAWLQPFDRKGKTYKYVIYINLQVMVTSGYRICDVIAHEICHAAQWEHNIFNNRKHHDEKFQKLCNILEKECKKLGVKLGKLYSPKTDVD